METKLANDDSSELLEGDGMTRGLITWVVGLLMLTLAVTSCGTLTGAAVGAGEAP